MINSRAVAAFHRIGRGHVHMEQMAAWLDHPWKQMSYLFKSVEKCFGRIFKKVAAASVEAAQLLGKAKTLKNVKTVLRNHL
eukprot:14355577-Ditylum_brightwellii.AAC.1